MRLNTLELKAFGCFTDKVLDLSQGNKGLHLVLGLNEAGKSTAIKAIHDLFFGIDTRSEYAFLHAAKNLRIGSELKLTNGETFQFYRRKGNKNTILDKNLQPLTQNELDYFLGSITEANFQGIFSTGHQELRQGGEFLSQEDNDLGQTLFAAGTGSLNFRELLSELDQQAKTIFKPSKATRPTLNNALAEYQKSLKKSRENAIKPEKWEQETNRFKEAKSKVTSLIEAIKNKNRELNRLARLQKTQPMVAHRQQILLELEDLDQVIILPRDFSLQRSAAQDALLNSASKTTELKTKIQDLEEQINQLDIPLSLLAQEKEVIRLYKNLGVFLEEIQRLPQLKTKITEYEKQAQTILKKLNPQANGLLPLQPLIALSDKALLLELSEEHTQNTAEIKTAKAQLEDFEAELAQTQSKLEKLPTPGHEIDHLAQTLLKAGRLISLDQEKKQIREKAKIVKQKLDTSLANLPFFQGTLEDLENISLPYNETIEKYDNLFQELKLKQNSLEQHSKQTQEEINLLTRDIENLEILGKAPTPQQVEDARQKRDHGWSLIKKSWLQKTPDPMAEAKFRNDLSLDQAYENSVEQADQEADRLFSQSEKATRLMDLKTRLDQATNKKNQLEQQIKDFEQDREQIRNDWFSIWSSLGISGQTPKEMTRWVHDFSEIKRLNKDLEEKKTWLKQANEKIDQSKQNILTILGDLKTDLPKDHLSFEELFEFAQSLNQSLQKAKQEQNKLNDLLDERHIRLKQAQAKLKKRQATLSAWQTSWNQALKKAGLSPDLSVNQAKAEIQALDDMNQALNLARQAKAHQEEILGKTQAYTNEVKALCHLVARDLSQSMPNQAIEQIYAKLLKAQKDHQNKLSLTSNLKEAKENLLQTQTEQTQAQEKLGQLCKIAKVSTPELLPEKEELSQKKQEQEQNLKHLETQILSHSPGNMLLKDLIKETQTIDPDELPIQKAEIEREIKEIEISRENWEKQKAEAKIALEQMDKSQEASQHAQEAKEHLAEVSQLADQYLAYHLAGSILKMEIERYRAKNQGPLLNKAGDFFAKLTGNRFVGLITDYDSKDNPILLGLRGQQGEGITTKAMSDGTCDQLYLALRLGALELFLEKHEPFPFILDDALVHFDDERSLNTFEVLADISKKTQVIFFSHHRHLQDLAQKAVTKDNLFVHHLGNS